MGISSAIFTVGCDCFCGQGRKFSPRHTKSVRCNINPRVRHAAVTLSPHPPACAASQPRLKSSQGGPCTLHTYQLLLFTTWSFCISPLECVPSSIPTYPTCPYYVLLSVFLSLSSLRLCLSFLPPVPPCTRHGLRTPMVPTVAVARNKVFGNGNHGKPPLKQSTDCSL